jgi:hypothetical protein
LTGDLNPRPDITVGLTVSNVGSPSVDLSLYGPGDIIGVDPRLIVRLEPKAAATDAEPNYLAAIEFDPPEFPWLFTPASANPQNRLRPWCVLVVLDVGKIGRPRVDRSRPLPFVELNADQVRDELPDLTQSWAWAHGQLMVEGGVTTDTAQGLRDKPLLNLSRLVCPRRLEAMKTYIACLVPAFDLGVLRGIGGTPGPDAKAKPAWSVQSPAEMALPIYFHWEFATGPDGDFEALARELKPFKCPPTVGYTPMFIWDSIPDLMATTTATAQAKPVLMDGALRASEGVPGVLADIDARFIQAITTEVNAPTDLAETAVAGSTKAISAPLYGGWHTKKTRVPASSPKWLRELNVDPRARVAAGLGAEVVRANQEDFMQACWEQVGKVIEANNLLNLGRFAMEALARLHARLTSLPADRMLLITAPAHQRLLHQSLTIRTGINRSSVPDAVVSAPFRRLTSAQRPALKATARREGATRANVALVSRLAAGDASVEPNRFVPDGLTNLRVLAGIPIPAAAGTAVRFSMLGSDQTITPDDLRRLKSINNRSDAARPPLTLRTDLRRSGLATDAFIVSSASVTAAAPGTQWLNAGTLTVFDAVLASERMNPGAVGRLVELDRNTGLRVSPLDVDTQGRVMLRTPANAPDRIVANLSARVVARGDQPNIGRVFDALPVGTVRREGTEVFVERDNAGALRVTDERGAAVVPSRTVISKPIASLNKTPSVVDRFEEAFTRTVDLLHVNNVEPQRTLVPFQLTPAAATTAIRLDPRRNVPARLRTMIDVGDARLVAGSVGAVAVAPTFDRIMVAPQLPEPSYLRLAAYDKESFLPGVDTIPINSVTLLETNPRFIEAFMVGLNFEMNRELLWRSFPTDQRGTPFKFFWDWDDGKPDITDIHTWTASNALGRNTRGAGSGQLVLLVRGQLLRRYPNSIISAWRAEMAGGRAVLKPNPVSPADYRRAAFFGGFPPDIGFAGFDLTREDIAQGNGWFFVIEQQPTEPRFGFDEAQRGAVAARPADWRDARWIDTATAPGRHLDAAAGPLRGVAVNGVEYVRDAAHFAAIALQRPFRVAIHAKYLTQL